MNTINEFPLLELKRSNKSPITNKGIDFLIEQIKDCDEHEWPPEQENRYVYWQPAMLEENSFELLKIHKLVILKNLERRMGCFAEINLWEWYWKQVVSNYFKDLRTELPFDIRPGSELEDYDGIEYLKLLSKSLSGGVNGTTEELEKHQIRLGQGNLSDAEYSRLLHLRNLSQIEDKALQSILTRGELKETFHYLATKCKYASRGYEGLTFYDSEEWEALLCEDHKINCVENLLISRFALWWGWSDAPFTCISKLVSSHLDSMIREGYLLRETGKPDKYQLSEEGYSRLKTSMDQRSKGKVLGWLRGADLASFSKDILLNYIEQLF